MTKLTRCIILTRVSTDAQTDNTSHQTQDEICTRFAVERGWHVVSRFHETESGAMYHTRVDTQAALTMLERDEADMLLLYDMTRYGRDVEYQHKMLKRITRARKQLQFTTLRLEYDPYTGELTPESGHIFATFGSTSALERQNIRRRTRNGLIKAAQEGRQPSRSLCPFGYFIVRKEDIIRRTYDKSQEGTYQVVEEEAETVRQIYKRFIEGESLRKLCEWLSKESKHPRRTRHNRPQEEVEGTHLPSLEENPNHGNWYPSTLRYLIQNPVYKGEAQFGRFRYATDDARIEQGLKKKYRVKGQKTEPIVVPVPPLVTPELWAKAQETMGTNRARRSGPRSHRYALTGLVYCPRCDARCYNANPHMEGGERVYGIRCVHGTRRHRAEVTTCSRTVYRGPQVERLVVDALEYIAARPEVTQSAQESYAQQREEKERQEIAARRAKAADPSALRRQIEQLQRREEAAAEAAVTARVEGRSPAAFEAAAERARQECKKVEVQLREVEAVFSAESFLQSETFSLPKEVDLALLWETLRNPEVEANERGQILSTLVERIYPVPSAVGLLPDSEGLRRPYKLGGVAVVLKTARPGPYFVVWNRITNRGGKGNVPDYPNTIKTLEIYDVLPLPFE